MRLLVFIVFIIISCDEGDCLKMVGFDIDHHLFTSVKKETGLSYCVLLEKTLENDSLAFSQLATIEVYDFATYQHGAIWIAIIDKIGEENFLKKIGKFSDAEKRTLLNSYVRAGFDFTQISKYKGKNICSAFPLIAEELNHIVYCSQEHFMKNFISDC